MGSVPSPPLILTLKLDRQSFNTLDKLRKHYFPPQRNFLEAHVTIFHALPGTEKDRIVNTLLNLCAQTMPLTLILPGPRFLGRGVALEINCPGLLHIRSKLVVQWGPWLSPQDRHGYQPHVTIQNKVMPDAARHLYDLLAASWVPMPATGEGLLLWQYMGGPWALLAEFPFIKGHV